MPDARWPAMAVGRLFESSYGDWDRMCMGMERGREERGAERDRQRQVRGQKRTKVQVDCRPEDIEKRGSCTESPLTSTSSSGVAPSSSIFPLIASHAWRHRWARGKACSLAKKPARAAQFCSHSLPLSSAALDPSSSATLSCALSVAALRWRGGAPGAISNHTFESERAI